MTIQQRSQTRYCFPLALMAGTEGVLQTCFAFKRCVLLIEIPSWRMLPTSGCASVKLRSATSSVGHNFLLVLQHDKRHTLARKLVRQFSDSLVDHQWFGFAQRGQFGGKFTQLTE